MQRIKMFLQLILEDMKPIWGGIVATIVTIIFLLLLLLSLKIAFYFLVIVLSVLLGCIVIGLTKYFWKYLKTTWDQTKNYNGFE